MTEPRHTLYAYVEGGDLAQIAPMVERHWREFVEAGVWQLAPPIVVNQRHPRTPEMRMDDLPSWDLGVNMVLPPAGEEPRGWFADVERVVASAGKLYAQIRRPIVLGVWDSQRRLAEDLFDVESPSPNVDELRALLGVGSAR